MPTDICYDTHSLKVTFDVLTLEYREEHSEHGSANALNSHLLPVRSTQFTRSRGQAVMQREDKYHSPLPSRCLYA
jgi:hypothetical protein